jgi:para-aminobenzoate synthetase component 1
MNREACIREINRLGSLNIPFCFLIDFEAKMPKLWRLDQEIGDFSFECNGRILGAGCKPSRVKTNDIRFEKYPIDQASYREMFEKTIGHILKGNSYLVNLTTATRIVTDLELEDFFSIGKSRYKCMLAQEFVSFSPESFVQIKQGRIKSFPMKGTIDASIPGAQEKILSDQKEAAEHATIVDLIRNDLGKVSTEVRVERYRYYEEITHASGRLGQVSSEISGLLPDDYQDRIGTILFSLLPAGSISGAPKRRTLEIIQEAEGSPRGYYSGIAGYFEDGVLDSCVLIRFLEHGGVYRSGGGITASSRMESEYQEMIEKIYVPIH